MEKIISKCKEELYRVFVENYKSWWKEEDIQSYFYHILISNIENGIGLVHREYPLYRSNLDLNHFWDFHIGTIDLVILDKPWEMNIQDCRIVKAFELKFPRDIKAGYSEGLKVIKTDFDKLNNQDAINVSENMEKHIMVFMRLKTKTSFTSLDDIKRFFEEKNIDIEFDKVKFSYIEVWPDGKHSDLFNNHDIHL